MAFGPMPPAEADVIFTITIPKEAYPYLQAFYAMKKLEVETEEQYLVRCLITYGKDYYRNMAALETALALVEARKQAQEQAKALIDSI
jgi:hypothetical protein